MESTLLIVMANDFRSARYWAKEIIEGALCEGAVALDATMGNGYDTLWLCGCVGKTGHVFAFDIQADAVERTRTRLETEGVAENATLINDGHQHMRKYVNCAVDAVVFNLGWLPGSEHNCTTFTQTTLSAVNAALELLKEDGVLTVCIYPGHEEGARERDALLAWATSLEEKRYDAMVKCYLNQSNSPPLMLAVRKKRQKKNRVD